MFKVAGFIYVFFTMFTLMFFVINALLFVAVGGMSFIIYDMNLIYDVFTNNMIFQRIIVVFSAFMGFWFISSNDGKCSALESARDLKKYLKRNKNGI